MQNFFLGPARMISQVGDEAFAAFSWLWVSSYRLYFVPPLSGADRALGKVIRLAFLCVDLIFGNSLKEKEASVCFAYDEWGLAKRAPTETAKSKPKGTCMP